MAKHLFPDSTKRSAGMKHIFRMGLRHGLRYGRVDVLDTNRVTFALNGCDATATGGSGSAAWIE